MPEHTTVDRSGGEPARKRRAEVVLFGLSGAMAATLVLLALIVIGASVVAAQRGDPGPGALVIGWHCAAAVLAALLQRIADRSRGPRSWSAALVVIAVAAATLWLWWWR